MNSGALDRELVRQYLLGRLDDQAELENKVSDEIFLNDAAMEIVVSLEDEIIEDYVEGKLDSAERQSVEEYFLRPPERRERLRFYRLLQNHLATGQADPARSEYTLPAGRADLGWIQAARNAFPSWGARLVVFSQAAALVALCIFGWTFRSGVHRKEALFESELALEKARSAQLETQVSQMQPPLQILTLVHSRLRSDAGAHAPGQLSMKPSTRRILVEIALTGSVAGSYSVRLEMRQTEQPIWTAKLLPLVSSSGDARLLFELPPQLAQAGSYSLVVSSDDSGTDKGKYYDFDVER